ncbi:hypothetical protein RRG08_039275 [Elysia crispata]|uniref:Uncharacterized protein n=1 Tax=Elysia crispata TaxID=231223 RepID=A0AAE0Z7C8_9GAST|nr:hypothetical protein RRG08_039275 [Elysia crispata]
MSNGPRQTKQPPQIKICLVGDMAVGKTSLAHVFLQQPFKEHYQATVGGVVMARTLENPVVTCQVWDTAGMERYRALLPHYMRHARCAVIIYDCSNRETFDSVKNYWLDFVESCGEEGLVKILVGNKMDVAEKVRAVNIQEGELLAQSRDMPYIETSAKFGLNVDDLFILADKRVSWHQMFYSYLRPVEKY